jgi:SAM-dependent methyltransferase
MYLLARTRTELHSKFPTVQPVYKFPLHIIGTGGESLLNHAKQYDTLVSINVIEHVQNAYSYLTGLHRVLKPGGLLIYHDRFFDDPNEGNCVLGVNNYHPIRITRMVLDIFLDQFEEIYRSTEPTPRMVQGGCNEKPIYFIGIKK